MKKLIRKWLGIEENTKSIDSICQIIVTNIGDIEFDGKELTPIPNLNGVYNITGEDFSLIIRSHAYAFRTITGNDK